MARLACPVSLALQGADILGQATPAGARLAQMGKFSSSPAMT
jgi:hypothetical protein